MRRTLFAILFVLAFCAPAAAREERARKLDEFGRVAFSDMLARLDNFAIELQQAPDARPATRRRQRRR